MATRLPLQKKRRKALMSSTLKGVGTGFFRTTIMPGIGTAIGAGVGAVVGVISDLSLRKKKEARTLTGEQDRMFASAASKKRRASW
jgi:uncharacterized membrane protein